jgi:nucleoside-diphosphate-sugar epimerase
VKVLIAGGAGFIGSRVASALRKRGASITVLDNLSTGDAGNLDSGLEHSEIELIIGSIQDTELLSKIFVGFDYVINLAGASSIQASWLDPIATNSTNLEGCLKLLIASRDAKVRRFVLASSAAVYGDTFGKSADERMPAFPTSPYGLQKYAAESYCRMFSSEFGLPAVCLRYFNVYGPGQRVKLPSASVISRYGWAIVHGEVPVIYGDGSQRRDFIHVADAANAAILATEAPAERVAGKEYNNGSGIAHDLSELLTKMSNVTGKRIIPKFEPRRRGDINFSQAHVEAARNELEFCAETTLERGVTDILAYYTAQAASLTKS